MFETKNQVPLFSIWQLVETSTFDLYCSVSVMKLKCVGVSSTSA